MGPSRYFKTISKILILAMLHLCWLSSYAWAEMLPTESAVQPQAQEERQRILDLLDRQEVIIELENYGVSKVEAVARINSLSDAEVVMIAGKLDELAEGGNAGQGIVLYMILWPFIFTANIAICLPIYMIAKLFKGDSLDPDFFSDCMTPSFFWVEDTPANDVDPDCDPGMESCI